MSIIHDALKKAEKDRDKDPSNGKIPVPKGSKNKTNKFFKPISIIVVILCMVIVFISIHFLSGKKDTAPEIQITQENIPLKENHSEKIAALKIDKSERLLPENKNPRIEKKVESALDKKSILDESNDKIIPSPIVKKTENVISVSDNTQVEKTNSSKSEDNKLSIEKKEFKSEPTMKPTPVGTNLKNVSKISKSEMDHAAINIHNEVDTRTSVKATPIHGKKTKPTITQEEIQPTEEKNMEPEKMMATPTATPTNAVEKPFIDETPVEVSEMNEEQEVPFDTESDEEVETTPLHKETPVVTATQTILKKVKTKPSITQEPQVNQTKEPQKMVIKKKEPVFEEGGDSSRYYNKGVLFEKDGMYEEALRSYNKALELDPKNTKIHNGLGNVYMKLNKLELSKKELQYVLLMDPLDSKARNNLGLVYLKMNEYIKALEEFQKAINSSPTNVAAYNNLGITCKKLKKYNESLEYFNKALFLDSKYAEAYYGRATVLESLGKIQEAIMDYKKFIDYAPDYLKEQVRKVQDHVMDLYDSPSRY
jgi:Tfp pilus assembly protein PilF